ncbi:MAG: PEP-CTERM sorting domain-containing protein [Puniceicoccales bacterium]
MVDFQVDNINIAAVPEPRTYALFGGSTVLFFAFLRRRFLKS